MAYRALMDQMISVKYSYFSPAFMPIYFQRLLKPSKGMGAPDEEVVAKAIAQLVPVLVKLEIMLASSPGPFMAGEDFTLADLTFMPYFEQFGTLGLTPLLVERGGLAAWWATVEARPAWTYVREG